MSDDTRDRMIALEVEVKHLAEATAHLSEQVDVLTKVLERSRGAVLVLSGVSAVIGALASKLSAFLPGQSLPR